MAEVTQDDIAAFALGCMVKKIQRAIKTFLRKKHENLVIPMNYKCPITLELFVDPVVAQDGNTYEHEAILRVLATTMKSPLTGQRFANKTLVSNLNLRSEIMEFRQRNKLNIPTTFRSIFLQKHNTRLAPGSASAARSVRSPPLLPTPKHSPFTTDRHSAILQRLNLCRKTAPKN